MSRYLNPVITIKNYEPYSMHVFGFIAFVSTFGLGIVALFKHFDTDHEDLALHLLYGIFIFLVNLFYLKVIRLSRNDYEERLKEEKEYSQSLLISQKHFLRHAVHETNTPLAVIMANIELYNMEEGEHPTLQNIEAATKNIFGIYDDLSYLTQNNKIEYPKHSIVLSNFVESRIDFFSIVAQQSDLTFEIMDTSDEARIYFNETELQRIVDNNITNAIKYTLSKKIIHIKLTAHDEEVLFSITSNSTTIADPEHIFDAYYRENSREDGLGLGLNLVYNICKNENVTIALSSDEKVTSFTYHFQKAHNENTTPRR